MFKGPVFLGWVGQLKGAVGPKTLINSIFFPCLLLNSMLEEASG